MARSVLRKFVIYEQQVPTKHMNKEKEIIWRANFVVRGSCSGYSSADAFAYAKNELKILHPIVEAIENGQSPRPY